MKALVVSSFLLLSTVIAVAQFQVQTKWDIKQLSLNPVWSRVGDIYGEAGSIESVEFSQDGRYIVSGSKFDNSVIMWRTSDGFELWRQTLPQEIERVAWSPDGKYLVTAGNDPFIRFFRTADILSGDRIYTALQVHAGDQAEYLDFNADGSMMVSAHQDGIIRLWIVMSEDPTVNARRHEWVKEQQAKAESKRRISKHFLDQRAPIHPTGLYRLSCKLNNFRTALQE